MPWLFKLFTIIAAYGYLAVFIGAIFEGESFLLLAGLLAQQDHLSFSLIAICAFVGAVIGDLSWFLLGRYRGQRILNRWAWFKKIADRPVTLIGRKPRLISFLTRFMYGFRHIVPFSLGMTAIPTRTFVSLNALGAALWATTFSVIGYLLGDALELALGRVRRYELALVIVVILALAAFNFLARLLKNILKQAAED